MPAGAHQAAERPPSESGVPCARVADGGQRRARLDTTEDSGVGRACPAARERDGPEGARALGRKQDDRSPSAASECHEGHRAGIVGRRGRKDDRVRPSAVQRIEDRVGGERTPSRTPPAGTGPRDHNETLVDRADRVRGRDHDHPRVLSHRRAAAGIRRPTRWPHSAHPRRSPPAFGGGDWHASPPCGCGRSRCSPRHPEATPAW